MTNDKDGPHGRSTRESEILSAIETALQAIDSLDEDRIIRCFVNAITAAVRRNGKTGQRLEQAIFWKICARFRNGSKLEQAAIRASEAL